MIGSLGSLVFVLVLAGSSASCGALLGLVIPLPRGPGEKAIESAAGLGISALLLTALAARHLLAYGALVLVVLALPGFVLLARLRPAPRSPRSFFTGIAAGLIALAALSALAPVTDPDSLATPIPIACDLVATGEWRFTPERWMSAFPLSQEMLLSAGMKLYADRLGVLSAFELVLCFFLLESLARRAGLDETGRGAALVLGLGCPAVAFLAPSAKEDLLLAVATLGAAHALLSLETPSGPVAAGLFAGFAAGAKLSGIPIAIAVVLAAAGAPERRVRAVVAAAVAALLSGGIWYAANLVRFGNPAPPYFSPPLSTFLSPLSTRVALHALRWGEGRSVLDFFLAPVRMLVHPAAFGTAAGLFNPLVFLGLFALALSTARRRFAPLVFGALFFYACWFASDQVARLLLPAALLLAVPASVVLSKLTERSPVARVLVATALVLSAASALLFSGIRIARWARDPASFVSRDTQNAEDIAWMNAHLDPARHHVATTFKASSGLTVPWFDLEPTYQAILPAEIVATGPPLAEALARVGATHLFIPKGSMPSLEPLLVPVHENPASILGGVHLFRPDPTVATVVYAIPSQNRKEP